MVEIADLGVTFRRGGKSVKAVNGVSLSVQPGEVVALLGESGSGKSVTMRSLLRLHPPGTLIEGSLKVAGRDVMALDDRALSSLRGGTVSMIFQEPRLALDPVYRVGDQIVEAIRRHEPISKADARARALALFEKVRIPSPERRLDNYPHEMSGGMLQRAMIAMALACNPKVLLADEPTTALDATVQIQILLLIRDLQRELGLSVIFVTHDIGVAVEIADRIAVMYAGRIVEEGRVADILARPRHPYTHGLLGARVELANGRDRLETIPGSPPDLSQPIAGCAFSPRCSHAQPDCRATAPKLHGGVACHHPVLDGARAVLEMP
jgi:peptide/nickel transport system ATP-binding protein